MKPLSNPTAPVILRPAYDGASFYAIISASDHRNWDRAARLIARVCHQLCQDDDLWCGLIVAGTHYVHGQTSTDEQNWFYYDGSGWLHNLTPHEAETPTVFRSVRRACARAIACSNLPHILRYNVYLWIKPETYAHKVQNLVGSLQQHQIEVRH